VILLTLRDLRYRMVRFVVVAALGAVVFSLLFLMTGLVEQFRREPVDTVGAFGASAWLLPEGVAGPFTSASAMPILAVDVADADDKAPVVASRGTAIRGGADDEIFLVGVVPGALGAPPLADGAMIAADDEVVVDRSLGADIGSTLEIGGEQFTVVGRTTATTLFGGLPLVFMTVPAAQQQVFRTPDVVSAVIVSGDVRSVPDGLVAMPAAEVAENTLQPLDGAITSIDLVRVLLWIVAAVIIGSVVYLSALERQRDFAVLKAVGVSNRTLLASLALQAVLVALAAIAMAAVLQRFLAPLFPLAISVPPRAYWQLPLVAVAVALLAGLVGMRRVARSDPAAAFAGAGA
jgi:putative ABC transport system permease protein